MLFTSFIFQRRFLLKDFVKCILEDIFKVRIFTDSQLHSKYFVEMKWK